ncbi:hypothetical protein CR513_27613, partial [Mucuna pruriens]
MESCDEAYLSLQREGRSTTSEGGYTRCGHAAEQVLYKVRAIMIKDEEFEEWSSLWYKLLIVHLLGKKVSFKALENK